MLIEIIFGVVLIACVFFAIQIFTGNKRLRQLGEREIIEDKTWLERYGDEFPGMEKKDVIAGLRYAGMGFNFEWSMLRPDDSWGTTLAPTTDKPKLDPAIKDWEQLAQAKNLSKADMGQLTLRDFIEYYGPRPEAQDMLEKGEEF